MGYNCMAIDLRSGEAVNGIRNDTWAYCDSLGLETKFTDAYYDVQAAVKYARTNFPAAKIILFGSSYSASLALKYAGDYTNSLAGVVAFSPAEYFSKFGWSRTVVQVSASRITCPVLIASSASEKDRWQAIYDAIPHQNKVSYVPAEGGIHGAKTLWNTFPESKGYWTALNAFLQKFR
jgi:pimeloyl-ACP methyl ester carboxylesterase